MIVIRLENDNLAGPQAHAGILEHFVGIDLVGIILKAVKSRVHEWKMRRVDKIFHGTEAVRMVKIRSRVERAEVGVGPFWKYRDIVLRIAQCGPDEAHTFNGSVRKCPRLGRGRLVGCRWNQNTLRRAVVTPSMIGANDRILFDPTFRKPGAPMNAQIFPYVHLA